MGEKRGEAQIVGCLEDVAVGVVDLGGLLEANLREY